MINRKRKVIVEASNLLKELNEVLLFKQSNPNFRINFQAESYSKSFLIKLSQIKAIACHLEIISWALNSNKEHIKYVSKVFAVPETYQRSEFGEASSLIEMRKMIAKTIKHCEHVIYICRGLRHFLSEALINVFIAHFH